VKGILVLLLAGCSSAGSSSPPPSSPDQLCPQLCKTYPAACLAPDCPDRCARMLAGPACRAESLALYQCQITATPDDYLCAGGRATLKEEVCTAQVKAWARCTLTR
jgi:hypothetical protein